MQTEIGRTVSPNWNSKPPKNDDEYFERMTRSLFTAGLNWKVIEKKWPDIKRLFANFSIDEVAQFNDDDIDRLLKDEGMIRSVKKITAVVANAQTMQKVSTSSVLLRNICKLKRQKVKRPF